MKRLHIINHLLRNKSNPSYLEIGVQNPSNTFDKINSADKVGVDPAVPSQSYTQGKGYQMTSDDFFSGSCGDKKFDIIFIDGLHTEEQVDKDLVNSLAVLKENGYIVLHDCNPSTPEFESFQKSGTVWRSIYKLRKNTNNLVISVVDTDHGCGIVSRGIPVPMNVKCDGKINYQFLSEYRKEILNLISIDEFKKRYPLK